MGILSIIIGMIYICLRHVIVEEAVDVGFDGESALKVS